jgi:hypothetical protein
MKKIYLRVHHKNVIVNLIHFRIDKMNGFNLEGIYQSAKDKWTSLNKTEYFV